MNLVQGIILGIIQGLTEFLPVSSSGHLVIIQSLFKNFHQPGISFDVFLHLGTLFSVLIYFRKDILEILSFKRKRLIILLIIGTVPAGIVGIFFKNFIENLFQNVKLVGVSLIFTGFLLYISDKITITDKKEEDITIIDAIIIGVFQAIAIIPGVSRSGSTITAGIFRNLKREVAVKFSFLLSIPAILGAVVLSLKDFQHIPHSYYIPYISGFLFSTITGIVSLKILSIMTEIKSLKYFSYYCWTVGILSFII